MEGWIKFDEIIILGRSTLLTFANQFVLFGVETAHTLNMEKYKPTLMWSNAELVIICI